MAKDDILEKIEKNIQGFDLYSLLKLLRSLGYKKKEIFFESNPNQASHASLCQAIQFETHPARVRIVLNMGLLGTNSPLPSFFQSRMESEDVNMEKFITFLNFFNHHLVHSFVDMAFPEHNDKFFGNWKEAQMHYLSLLGFESVSTLWFLMKICFPDLVVEVKKNPQKMKLHTASLILGRDCLGPTSFIGNRLNQTLSSFKVTFRTENEVSELGTPWPIEINKRLYEILFPILRKTDLHFSIILEIKNKYGYLTLENKTYIGFDRIWKTSDPFRLLLFYGHIKDLKKNSYIR